MTDGGTSGMNARCQALLMEVWHPSDSHDARALCRKLESVVERSHEGVTNLVADGFEDLRVGMRHNSRDFR